MKSIFSKMSMRQFSLYGVGVAIVLVTLFSTFHVQASTYSTISGDLDFGSRGGEVTSLQRFLASDTTVYPEGLVTGYYGPLTIAAVKRFQAKYGIEQVGRVGPLTRAKINQLIQGGVISSNSDVSGPQFISVNRTTSQNSVTFSWTTNEKTTAKVFYYTDWIKMSEGDINSVGFGSLNGSIATNDGVARTSQQVTVTGLLPNTTYHYVVVATDESGNVSVFDPNGTFKTSF